MRPASNNTLKIWNLAANPASGGMPNRLSRNTPSVITSTGARWISPRNDDKSSEPVRLRRNATTAKAPRFMNRYATR